MKLNKTYDFIVGDKSVVKFTTVFIHGIAGDAGNFAGLFEFLKGVSDLNIRVVAYDLLGSGGSDCDSELGFGYDGQLEALASSLSEIEGPIVLVGHSMGTLIATRYAALYPDSVRELVLISPPIYTPENLESEEFKTAMEGFQEKVKAESLDKIKCEKAFNEETTEIVMNPENYRYLVETKCRTKLIYGEKDKIIAAFNVPAVVKANPLISAVKTAGGHSVTSDKYEAVVEALRGIKK